MHRAYDVRLVLSDWIHAWWSSLLLHLYTQNGEETVCVSELMVTVFQWDPNASPTHTWIAHLRKLSGTNCTVFIVIDPRVNMQACCPHDQRKKLPR